MDTLQRGLLCVAVELGSSGVRQFVETLGPAAASVVKMNPLGLSTLGVMGQLQMYFLLPAELSYQT